jgi:hypothetical protein
VDTNQANKSRCTGFDPTLSVHGATLMDELETKVEGEGEEEEGRMGDYRVGLLGGLFELYRRVGFIFSLKSQIPGIQG